jgi:hypothetical protein
MRVRVPRIAREVVDRNRDFAAAVQRAVEKLAVDIESDRPLPAPRPPGVDMAGWEAAHAERAGESWLGTQWFHAEFAFYRELSRCCRFWETGQDPFEPAKEEELSDTRLWQRLAAAIASGKEGTGGARDARFFGVLDAGLWGNRVDLSYAVAATRGRSDEDLIVDDRVAAAARLARPGARVHLVTDNTGTELAMDLALVGVVLDDVATRVTLHLKVEPVFVSDAMPRDLWRLLQRMRDQEGETRRLAEQLVAAFESERLALAPDPFWSGPHFLWQAPAHVRSGLHSATIVVVKGDANYRRVVGDALWPSAAPFAEACGYFPVPLVCVRTMKSDAVLGLPEGMAERLDKIDPEWRINGRRGVIQTYVPGAQ